LGSWWFFCLLCGTWVPRLFQRPNEYESLVKLRRVTATAGFRRDWFSGYERFRRHESDHAQVLQVLRP